MQNTTSKQSANTLIQIQEKAVADILALSENGKRAMGYGLTLLNKRGRGLAAIRRHYFVDASKLGYSLTQVTEQWGDIKDYALLCATCDE